MKQTMGNGAPRRRRPHYAWVITAACFASFGGVIGIINNCRGIFLQPMCEDLGFSLSALTLGNTFYGIAALVTLPLAGWLLPRCNIKVAMSLAAGTLAGLQALTPLYTHVAMFYVSFSIQGACSAFLADLPVSLLINNWFDKRKGMALGVAGISTGIIAIILNPVFAGVVEGYGWRAGYLASAGVLAVLMLPFTLFAVSYKPQDKGMLPYGAEEKAGDEAGGVSDEKKEKGPVELEGVTLERAGHSPVLWLLLAALFTIGIVTAYPQMFPGYAQEQGYSVMFGAQLVSMAMMGNIGGKLLAGWLNDRVGLMKASLACMSIVIVSYLVLLFQNGELSFRIGAVLGGVVPAMPMVLSPLFTSHFFGRRAYAPIQARVAMVNSFSNAVCLSVSGFIVDSFGEYRYSILFCMGSLLLSMVLVVVTFATGKKLRAEWLPPKEEPVVAAEK